VLERAKSVANRLGRILENAISVSHNVCSLPETWYTNCTDWRIEIYRSSSLLAPWLGLVGGDIGGAGSHVTASTADPASARAAG